MPCWRRRRRRTRRGRRRFEEFEGGEREGSQMKIVGGGGLLMPSTFLLSFMRDGWLIRIPVKIIPGANGIMSKK